MCQNPVEDWQHIPACPLIDTCLNRAGSWRLIKKSMERWKLPNDFSIAVEKSVLTYTENPKKAKDRPSPTTPFPMTFNSQRNTLKGASRAQSAIGWDNFLKGRVSTE
jgi:hypothetical protein